MINLIISHKGWLVRSAVLIFFVLSQIAFEPNTYVYAQNNSVTFPVGAGFTDVIPRQIVRSKSDRVYIFAGRSQYSPALVGYWTTAAGLPTSSSSFNGTTTVQEASNVISVNPVYDGNTIIHVLVNTQAGKIIDHPFDTTSNTFHAPITLATNGGTVVGDYVGTSGVSGMVDLNGQLNVSYWTATNHILYRAYTYVSSSNTLTPTSVAEQVDTGGFANHPALAVSPVDNSVTIAWVSEINAPTGKILVRTRSAGGVWSAVQTASSADAWTSTAAGINIDQGPSVIISNTGVISLSYIEDYDSTGDYGRVHFATYANSTWSDSAVTITSSAPNLVINGSTYTHDPALAINNAGQFFIIGHGPVITGTNKDMYTMRRNANGTWAVPKLFNSGNSFDSSPSAKWSTVGNFRPGVYEFIYFLISNNSYNDTTIYYGRFEDTAPNYQAAPARNYYTSATLDLTWSRITWATAYKIEVATTNTFMSTTVITTTVSADTFSATVSVPSNGLYYWHVRAKRLDGTWGDWSATDSFTVNAP